jgi:hypothetical protein
LSKARPALPGALFRVFVSSRLSARPLFRQFDRSIAPFGDEIAMLG